MNKKVIMEHENKMLIFKNLSTSIPGVNYELLKSELERLFTYFSPTRTSFVTNFVLACECVKAGFFFVDDRDKVRVLLI